MGVSISVSAHYHDGVLEPERPLALREGAAVRLTIEPLEDATPEAILRAARQVYAGLSEAEIQDLERVILDRSQFSLGRE